MADFWSDETICGHFGEEEAAPMHAVVPPLYLNSLHTFDTIEDMLFRKPDSKAFVYGRVNNPTTDLFEKKVAALEHGVGALAFGSGMAAITTAILSCVKPGGHIVAVTNCYGVTYRFMTKQLVEMMGVETTFVPGDDTSEIEAAIRPNTQLIYLESPTSMVFKLQDLKAVAEIAKRRGIYTAIDNTWATPLYQKPLAMGIDISLHTVSKYIGGHSDIIAGVAAFADQTLLDKAQEDIRQIFGGILGPFEAWLAIRGLRSLCARLEKHQSNAMIIADRLYNHPKVERLIYVGHPSHPQYELARRQMTGFTGLMSFIPKATGDEMRAFMNALKIFKLGVSWGGFESLAVMGMYGLEDAEARKVGGAQSIIRLAIGMENVEELWSDLEQAFSVL